MSEITRTEKFLRACIDGEPCALNPLTRVEKLLAELNDKLAGAPSEVVILPETVLTPEDGAFILTTPFAADLEDGKTYAVTFYGETYDCKAVYLVEEGGMSGFVLGNIPAESGLIGGNPDAPFMMIYSHTGGVVGQESVYCLIRLTAGLESWDGVSPVTLSIVQVGAASGGGSSSGGSGVCVVTVTADTENMSDFTNVKADKTFAEMRAAYESGGLLWCRLIVTMTSGTLRFECIHNATVLEATEVAMPMFVFQCVSIPSMSIAIKDDDSVWVMNEE